MISDTEILPKHIELFAVTVFSFTDQPKASLGLAVRSAWVIFDHLLNAFPFFKSNPIYKRTRV